MKSNKKRNSELTAFLSEGSVGLQWSLEELYLSQGENSEVTQHPPPPPLHSAATLRLLTHVGFLSEVSLYMERSKNHEKKIS